VLQILHEQKFRPYHISLHQELYGTDFLNCIKFCQLAQQNLQANNSFFATVLFTDEASVNLYIMHY
jgi:hypothetical protein